MPVSGRHEPFDLFPEGLGSGPVVLKMPGTLNLGEDDDRPFPALIEAAADIRTGVQVLLFFSLFLVLVARARIIPMPEGNDHPRPGEVLREVWRNSALRVPEQESDVRAEIELGGPVLLRQEAADEVKGSLFPRENHDHVLPRHRLLQQLHRRRRKRAEGLREEKEGLLEPAGQPYVSDVLPEGQSREMFLVGIEISAAGAYDKVALPDFFSEPQLRPQVDDVLDAHPDFLPSPAVKAGTWDCPRKNPHAQRAIKLSVHRSCPRRDRH